MLHSKRTILFLITILLFTIQVYAQENHTNHSHNFDSVQNDTTQKVTTKEARDLIPEKNEVPSTSESVFVPLRDFPTLHPLVVHFPPVLLFLAFFTQLFGLFAKRRVMSWITIALLLAGFVAALLASQVFHPHVSNLPDHTREVYNAHEYYANATIWLAGIALLLKLVSHFALKSKTWAEVVIFLVISGSAITVGLAGHLGTQMAYIENVGPQGNYLEEHEH